MGSQVGGNSFFYDVLCGGGISGSSGLEYASGVGEDAAGNFLPVLVGSVITGCFIHADTGAWDRERELDSFSSSAGYRCAVFAFKCFFIFPLRKEQKCLRDAMSWINA